jgi:hypothetical protein
MDLRQVRDRIGSQARQDLIEHLPVEGLVGSWTDSASGSWLPCSIASA